ncbi:MULTISPECIES: hypothetical protein [unclassified Paenibacillus]|uniref:hypothetical protein n=1 Tax=unclassified Paenibacillus TaxID=185978 RepID=UPI0027886963|nr:MULTISPECIES: hypothetical protein [unclassified Paenibacillus]MDQ0896207.1 hypothetical protein [Paenibacillus sp. V4I7]MDQ0913977.1 hypothetical protein [Paenibacillus sp. V4I5]
MTKLVVTLLVCALLAGVGLYVGGTRVAPAAVTKSGNINTSVTGATVNTTTGVATATAP